MNIDCTKPGLENSTRLFYRQMALLARAFMFSNRRLLNKRFLWRFAPVLSKVRDHLSEIYGYRIPQEVYETIQNRPFKLSGYPWNGVASGVWWGGLDGFEPEETNLVATFANEYMTMLDIGANVGWFSMIAATMNNRIKVFAFEPNPNVYKILLENFKMNKVNGETMNIAVSDVAGELSFYLSEDDWASSLIPDSTRSRRICIHASTIDDVVSKYGLRPDFLKIDVEGSEMAVLRGANTCLSDIGPDILFEISPKITHIEKLLNLLNNCGYKNFWTFSNVGITRDDGMKLCVGRTTINYFTSKRKIL